MVLRNDPGRCGQDDDGDDEFPGWRRRRQDDDDDMHMAEDVIATPTGGGDSDDDSHDDDDDVPAGYQRLAQEPPTNDTPPSDDEENDEQPPPAPALPLPGSPSVQIMVSQARRSQEREQLQERLRLWSAPPTTTTSDDAMAMDSGKVASIKAAMANVVLPSVPAWAREISDQDWQSMVQSRLAGGGGAGAAGQSGALRSQRSQSGALKPAPAAQKEASDQ